MRPPFVWTVSQFCEEFSCTPLVAVCEMESDPMRYGETVMLLRYYQRTVDQLDRQIADPTIVLRETPMLALVKRNTARWIEELVAGAR